MSLRIAVQKDIGEYEEKIVGKMSLRTLACVGAGFASAAATAAVIFFGFGADVSSAAPVVMLSSMPFWLAGFWRPFGMRAEEFAPLMWQHATKNQKLAYEPCLAADVARLGERPPAMKRAAKKKATRKGAELYEPSKEG